MIDQIVPDVGVVGPVGGVADTDDQQEVGVGLGDREALLLDLQGQTSDRLLNPILDLNLGNIGVGPLGEGDGDLRRA